MPSTTWPIFAHKTDGAPRAPIVIFAAGSIFTRHLIRSLSRWGACLSSQHQSRVSLSCQASAVSSLGGFLQWLGSLLPLLLWTFKPFLSACRRFNIKKRFTEAIKFCGHPSFTLLCVRICMLFHFESFFHVHMFRLKRLVLEWRAALLLPCCTLVLDCWMSSLWNLLLLFNLVIELFMSRPLWGIPQIKRK